MSTTRPKRRWIDIILWIVLIVLVVVMCLRLFVLADIEVDGISMYPTLEDGDSLWGNRLANVSRGDIVVFECDDSVYIKRAVALSGDCVWVEYTDGQYLLYVLTPEGTTLTESYMYQGSTVQLSQMLQVGFLQEYDSIDNSYTVPDNSMIALGDNREVSHDSRYIGAVSLDMVIAVIVE